MQKIDSPKESKKGGYKTTTTKIYKADNTQINTNTKKTDFQPQHLLH